MITENLFTVMAHQHFTVAASQIFVSWWVFLRQI